jgi:hypothetical protein
VHFLASELINNLDTVFSLAVSKEITETTGHEGREKATSI